MCQNNLVKTSTDKLRLATGITKLEPTWVAQSRDSVEELIKAWYRPTQNQKDISAIHVVIVREIIDATPDKTEFTRMKKGGGRAEIDAIKKEKKGGRPGQKATKKRSFSVANADETARRPAVAGCTTRSCIGFI
jgi:hypothetical protein